MLPTNGRLPVPKVIRNRNPEERNIIRKLGKVRRYLTQSTTANMTSEWERLILRYEMQLVKAEARAIAGHA